MPNLTFVTGNSAKFHVGATICKQYDIQLHQIKADIVEIQAEAGEVVAARKVADAFSLLQKPLVISDDSWMIPGLNNFPGPYMKSMNHWFTPEDWLRLSGTLTDRRIILHLVVCYQDRDCQKIFSADIEGELLHEIKGQESHSHNTIVTFNGGRTSLAEDVAAGHVSSDVPHSPWHAFAQWYKEYTS